MSFRTYCPPLLTLLSRRPTQNSKYHSQNWDRFGGPLSLNSVLAKHLAGRSAIRFRWEGCDSRQLAPSGTFDGRALSGMMSGYWSNFVWGDPNGPGIPQWPPCDPSLDVALGLDTTLAVIERVRTEMCNFWDLVH